MRVLEQDGSGSVTCGNGARAVGRCSRPTGPAPSRPAQGRHGTHDRANGGRTLLRPDGARNQFWRLPPPQPRGGAAVSTLPRLRRAARRRLSPRSGMWTSTLGAGSTVPRANCTVVSRRPDGRILPPGRSSGVNRETNSCGTGATSAAQLLLDMDAEGYGPAHGERVVHVRMKGGTLRVRISIYGQGSFLEGPAEDVGSALIALLLRPCPPSRAKGNNLLTAGHDRRQGDRRMSAPVSRKISSKADSPFARSSGPAACNITSSALPPTRAQHRPRLRQGTAHLRRSGRHGHQSRTTWSAGVGPGDRAACCSSAPSMLTSPCWRVSSAVRRVRAARPVVSGGARIAFIAKDAGLEHCCSPRPK